MRKKKIERFKKQRLLFKDMVEINQNNVSVFFDYLGFSLKDGEESTYCKSYKKCKNYEVKIILDKDEFKK